MVFCNMLNNISVYFLDQLRKNITESLLALNNCSVLMKKIFLKIKKFMQGCAHIRVSE